MFSCTTAYLFGPAVSTKFTRILSFIYRNFSFLPLAISNRSCSAHQTMRIIMFTSTRRFQIGQITFHSTHIYSNSFRMGDGRCAPLDADEAFINYLFFPLSFFFKLHFFSFHRVRSDRVRFVFCASRIGTEKKNDN